MLRWLMCKFWLTTNVINITDCPSPRMTGPCHLIKVLSVIVLLDLTDKNLNSPLKMVALFLEMVIYCKIISHLTDSNT